MISSIFANLHGVEEDLRRKAEQFIARDSRLALHLEVVYRAMDLADTFRQRSSSDENVKALQILGMRTFNAFAASMKLALSGYFQNSALLMRDILETAFLLDFFRSNPTAIEQWRCSDRKERMNNFSPRRIREALDARDGLTEKKRAAMYEMFSELAGHPTMNSMHMMRPQKHGDAEMGPFMEVAMLRAALLEMGRLAVQVGEHLNVVFAGVDEHGTEKRVAFSRVKQLWMREFYSLDPGTDAY